MACVHSIMSWTSAILHLVSQETYLLIKVIIKCVNITLLDILDCFHYILNAPRILHRRPKYRDMIEQNASKMTVFKKSRLTSIKKRSKAATCSVDNQ